MYQKKPRQISDFRSITERLYGVSIPEEKAEQKKEERKPFLEPPPFTAKAIPEGRHE